MTDPVDATAGLEPPDERLGEQLAADRAIPAAGFRGALRRRILAQDPGYGPRPPRLRLAIAGYISAGALLIVLGALQATGSL